jgi:hypothetical protein
VELTKVRSRGVIVCALVSLVLNKERRPQNCRALEQLGHDVLVVQLHVSTHDDKRIARQCEENHVGAFERLNDKVSRLNKAELEYWSFIDHFLLVVPMCPDVIVATAIKSEQHILVRTGRGRGGCNRMTDLQRRF